MKKQTNSESNNSISLVLAADRQYLAHFATTVTSALQSSPSTISRIFLLSTELTEADLAEFNKRTMDEYGARIETVTMPRSLVDRYFVSGHVSASAYLRFFVAEALPDSEDSVLYLDCDTLVVGDLGKLALLAPDLEQDSSGDSAWLAACVNESSGSHLEQHGFRPGRYFNSGVMLINLAAWRRESMSRKLANKASELFGLVPWWDQDVLNIVIEDRWVELDPEFNFTGKTLVSQPIVVHFAGDTKPWHFGCTHPNRNDYLSFRKLTPFRSFRREKFGKFLGKKLLPRGWRNRKEILKSFRRGARRVRKTSRKVVRLSRNFWLTLLRDAEGSSLARMVGSLARGVIRTRGTSLYLRRLADFASPSSPLDLTPNPPAIEIHIAAAAKDFSLLPLVISQALANCPNPVEKIAVIVPDSQDSLLPELPGPVEIIRESTVLPKSTLETIESHHPDGRRGWILQQALTLWTTRNSDSPGVLVLDADTVLTKARVLLGENGRQLLSYSREYHQPYELHASKIWGPRKRDFGLSYVCHHQLMQPDVVREMFPSVGDFERWILAADLAERSPISDYHSYGRWLVDNFPSRVARARWGNQSVPLGREDSSKVKEQILQHLSMLPDNVYSASFHHYLNERKNIAARENFVDGP